MFFKLFKPAQKVDCLVQQNTGIYFTVVETCHITYGPHIGKRIIFDEVTTYSLIAILRPCSHTHKEDKAVERNNRIFSSRGAEVLENIDNNARVTGYCFITK